MKNVTVITGTKWGDEGKGKIASLFSKDADIVVRSTGGNNAGHTVVYKNQKIPLHLVPGGISYPHTTAVIAPGVMINPDILLKEIQMLKEVGIPDIDERLRISGRAQVILPYHCDLDELYENLKSKPIGTTRKGIGPSVIDKAARVGLQMYDLLCDVPVLQAKIEEAIILHNQNFANNNMKKCIADAEALAKRYHALGQELRKYIVDVFPIYSKAFDNNQKIVVEGAQAFMLDPDGLNYPMNTTCGCVASASLHGANLPVTTSIEVIGVDKAYNTRVGNGPFPTEVASSIGENGNLIPYKKPLIGDTIREYGGEFGTTTGRPRRCGWMDCPILYTEKLTAGIDALCINHLDTLGKIGCELGFINICIGYKYQGQKINYFPDDIRLTGEIPSPIYRTLWGGWYLDNTCHSFNQLPDRAKEYVRIVEEYSENSIRYIGTGPANEDLIVRD